MESDIEAIFSNNSKQLKKLFEALHPSEGKISIQEFLVFCKNVRIHPVILNQELVSINEIKKIIQQLDLKQGITIGNIQLMLRLLSEQSFNTTSSVSDKLRMLFIHIRSPCKLFYQVSLNFNVSDSSSEELEVDQLDYQKIQSLRKSLKDTQNQDISHKVLRNRYLSTSPDVVFLQEKSPKNICNLSETKKKPEQVRLNNTLKQSRENSKAPINQKNPVKTKDLKSTFDCFKNKHIDIISKEKTTNISKKISKRRDYACALKSKMFSSMIVKRMLFTAWKGVCRKFI